VLVILPPSESKLPAPDGGWPVDLDALSFPPLTPLRIRIAEALVATSARPDAFRRLQVRPTVAGEVARNTHLLELPARPASEVYAGPLHDGFDAATLSPAASGRAARSVVITSALWGALRPGDRIPPYRLHICSRLVGMDRLEPAWRSVLPGVLADAAGGGVVLDLRSPVYQAAGRPTGLANRTAVVRVTDANDGGRIGEVVAKRIRGQLARHMLESGEEPEDPAELAALLGERWPVVAEPPLRPGHPWTLTVMAGD
jgi:cytoplasmic iron level regulating protein YaaA (DUF328/UPF0246 family)